MSRDFCLFRLSMKRHFPFRLAVLSLATLSASALADVVTLKNGSKIEGKITAETDAQITLSVKSGTASCTAR